MQVILNSIVDILSQPAILVALITFIGLIVQKKPAAAIASGTIKMIPGFLILSTGADVVVRSLEPFDKIFQHALGVRGIAPNNETIVSLTLKDLGTTAALIMVYGMIVNISIAHFTNLKYIFLAGHHTFYMAVFLAIVLAVSHTEGWLTIVIGVLVLGLIIAVLPALPRPAMRKITGNGQVVLGHFGSIGYSAIGAVGQLLKGESKSTEEIKPPKGLSFLRESTINISITMALLYFIAYLFAGVSYVHESISDGQNFIAFSLIQGVTLTAGVSTILTGVRLILAEIVPAFRDISEKPTPNPKSALDCPIMFPHAQNIVLIGFSVSFATGVIGMFILSLFGGVVILPGIVTYFFLGTTAAVFGNARDGIRGTTAGAALNGIPITFLPLLFLPFLNKLGGTTATLLDTGLSAVSIVFGNAAKYMGLFGAILFIIIVDVTAALLKGRQKSQ